MSQELTFHLPPTIGVFHIHPNVSHGAAKDDVQKGIMPLVTEYHCDAITGDANKSANTFSKLQSVYNPEHGLMNYIMRKFKNLWNGKKTCRWRSEWTCCTIKSIARHHLHMKEGSGFDRTFPDCMMTFVFSWGKTDIQQEFRKFEISKLDQNTMDSMIADVDKVISDYKVNSAERYKLGPCDSDSHTPLLVYICSLAADQERIFRRKKEYNQNRKKENDTAWKPWSQSYQQGWKSLGYQGWEDYGGGYASQSDSSYRWHSQKR